MKTSVTLLVSDFNCVDSDVTWTQKMIMLRWCNTPHDEKHLPSHALTHNALRPWDAQKQICCLGLWLVCALCNISHFLHGVALRIVARPACEDEPYQHCDSLQSRRCALWAFCLFVIYNLFSAEHPVILSNRRWGYIFCQADEVSEVIVVQWNGYIIFNILNLLSFFF